MKVILIKDNSIKEVSFGYATNYLFPRNLALPATPDRLKDLAEGKLKLARKQAKQKAKNTQALLKIDGKKFVIKSKAGDKGRLFGAITKKELAGKIGVDKREIVLTKPIKKIGAYQVEIKIGSKKAKVKIEVKPEQ